MSKELFDFQEIQVEAGKAFGEETAKQAFSFLNDILRPPAKQLGGIIADSLQFYRYQNQIKILKKAKDLHDENGLPIRKVPLKFAASVINESSWEEDEGLQEKWANLIANAAGNVGDPGDYETFSELLRQITPIQARVLDLIYSEIEWPARRFYHSRTFTHEAYFLARSLGVDDSVVEYNFENLIRLNLLRRANVVSEEFLNDLCRVLKGQLEFVDSNSRYFSGNIDRNLKRHSKNGGVVLTALGIALVERAMQPFGERHRLEIMSILSNRLLDILIDDSKKKELCVDLASVYKHALPVDAQYAIDEAIRLAKKQGKLANCFSREDITDCEIHAIAESVVVLLDNIYKPTSA